MPTVRAARTDFGRRLRKLRQEAGITILELPRRSGIFRTTIGRRESGERQPLWLAVLALCRGLGVTPDAFVGEGDLDAEPAPKKTRAKKKS
jgi:transcriptional regulator with XRE-family HTH domain